MYLLSVTSRTFCFLAGLGFIGALSACGPIQFSKSSPDPVVVNDGNGGNNGGGPTRDVHYTNTVTASDNKVDVVLIVDDSSSMSADNQKLADKLAGFVSTLQSSNIDWQMCVTVTRPLTVNGNQSWGASLYWQNYTAPSGTPGWVLKPVSGQNLAQIFSNTMNYIGSGYIDSEDERGIKSAYWHVYNGDYHYGTASKCYRQGAAVSYIIISDEDERSIGGNQSLVYYPNEANKPLQNDDLPAVLVQSIKDTFGNDKKFTVNSIIVKPSDSACMTAQDAAGSKSHYGVTYAELSNLSAGQTGSICDADYTANLNLFASTIQNSLASVALECAPVGNVAITITPTMANVVSKITGSTLTFTPAIPAGRTLDVQYKCYQ